MRIPAPHIVEEALKRDRPVQEDRPRVHVPHASPEYLRWLEEEKRREKEDSEKENSRGVVIFQM